MENKNIAITSDQLGRIPLESQTNDSFFGGRSAVAKDKLPKLGSKLESGLGSLDTSAHLASRFQDQIDIQSHGEEDFPFQPCWPFNSKPKGDSLQSDDVELTRCQVHDMMMAHLNKFSMMVDESERSKRSMSPSYNIPTKRRRVNRRNSFVIHLDKGQSIPSDILEKAIQPMENPGRHTATEELNGEGLTEKSYSFVRGATPSGDSEKMNSEGGGNKSTSIREFYGYE